MAEKITVKDFIEKMNGDVSVLEVRDYIPITEKRVVIEKLVSEIITEDGLLTTYDSIAKDMIFSLAAISTYTNLIPETDKDYDRLRETRLMFDIFERMNVHGDFKDFHDMFEMRFKDYMRESTTLSATLNKLVASFKSVMENIDINQLEEFMKALEDIKTE